MLKNIDKKSAIKLAVGVVAGVSVTIGIAVVFNKYIPIPTNKLGQIAYQIGKGIAVGTAGTLVVNGTDALVNRVFEDYEINEVEAA